MDETSTNSADSIRLNKYLASIMAIGRRRADILIAEGRVQVNGSRPELGSRVTPHDRITINGKTIGTDQQPPIYLALNKPVGYVCSRRQQGDMPTIYALLPQKYQHLKPVGRLDKDSSGLLLLTNDGDFAHRMTHPSFHKTKSYNVELDQPLLPLHHQMINDIGIALADGVSKLSLQRMHDGNDTAWQVSMHEGRNRQIRRTFDALGYKVIKLHRIQFGTYSLGSLKPGDTKLITA